MYTVTVNSLSLTPPLWKKIIYSSNMLAYPPDLKMVSICWVNCSEAFVEMWVTKIAIDIYIYWISFTLLPVLLTVTFKLKYFFSKRFLCQVNIVAVCVCVNINSINIDVTSGQWAILGRMFKCVKHVAIFPANTFSVVNVNKIRNMVQTTTFAPAASRVMDFVIQNCWGANNIFWK